MKELSPYYQLAREFALSTNQNIFLTGKAGTGKTTFLHNLRNETKKQMAIVAPTGVAAINAGGTTIHSFFQLPFTPFIPTIQGRKDLIDKIKMVGFRRKVIQELELLVIDEVSMVRADLLDAVDTVLRQIRYKHTEPFGGVQVIFIGDMFQLSPVANENEWRLLGGFYQSPYFFHSQVIQQKQPVYIEFDKIFRQTNAQFIQLLNEVRNNCLTNESLKLLNSRFNPLFEPDETDNYITLTTHNYKADKINADELIKIKQKSRVFKAEIKGEFPEKSYPTEHELTLKVGAKVMFIKNDNESVRRFYNGKIGIVQDFDDEKIIIQCYDDDEPIELGKMIWENIRYSTNTKTNQIEESTLGTFVQYPLRLAWAITIHKSQGLTFEKAIIDAGSAFAAGQVYVALSRCKSLEGMVLLSKISPNSIENDREIVAYEKNKSAIEDLEYQLNFSRNKFRLYTLHQLFDFKTGIGQTQRLIRETEELKSSFNEDTIPFLKEILKQLEDIQQVSTRFQNQLFQIFEGIEINEDYLTERLNAATTFFIAKTELLTETIKQSPASTDSREHGRDFTENLRSIYAFSSRKLYIFKNLRFPFSVEDYFDVKNNYYLSDFNVNAYSKTHSNKPVVSRNPDLYIELLNLRNQICEQHDTPIFLVAGSKSLLEMADYLPKTNKELLNIYGFGPAKVEKYGNQFIELIQQYCSTRNLKPSLFEFNDDKISKKKKKNKNSSEIENAPKKKQKGETFKISYELYKSGKTIEEIANERNLAVSTICNHLGKFISLGELDINSIIPQIKRDQALKIMENSDNSEAFKALEGVLKPTEINIFYTWFRENKKGN